MDTPERGHQPPPAQQQIGTPVSRVEDSPVFNYINSLSPIKPVKPLHITQSFQSLNFTTIPVFTSPHVNTHKGSRFSTRHPLSDLSKSEDISNNGGKTTQCMGVSHDAKLSDFSVTAREGHDIRCSLDESTIVSFDECPSQSNKLSQPLPYDCGSPNHNTAPFYGGKSSINLATNSNLMIDYIHDDLEETEKPVASDLELRNGCHIQESNQEVQGCDWENMITDGSEGLLVCESYTEVDTSKACALAVDHDMNATTHSSRPSEDTVSNSQKTQVDESLVYFQDALQEPLVESQSETSHTLQPFSGSCENPLSGEASEEMDNGIGDYMPLDNEVHSQQQRGMRRRCLVFETAGANKKLLHNDTNRSLPTLLSSQGKFSSGDRHSKSSGTRVGPSPHGLPSIGLHLNSICSTSKERMPKNETASQKQLSMLGSIHPFPSLRTDQKPLEQISISVEKDCQSVVGVDQDLQVTCDTLQAPVTAVAKGEESNCSSPKKKKRISESSNESDSCKRCNCKKSKCLKLYCECFAAGVYCVEPCACQGCLNNPMHEDTVLATRKQIESRNPLAFAPKVIRTSEPVLEIGEEANKTPASARHKRGCNCKKSNCLKKYCECYQGGVGCSINCRCEGCKNKFGTKDGKMPNENEETGHDEEIDAYEKYSGKRDNLRITNVQNDEQKKIESALPVTPSFEVSRPAAKPPCPSTGKPPRSTMLIKLNGFRTLQKFEMVPHRPKFENHSRVTPEDETPEMLRDDASSPCQSKISSPKRKRVSPPHNESGISPIHKGSRKLILKSIPSFPSLISDPDYEFSANSSNPPISSQLDQDIS